MSTARKPTMCKKHTLADQVGINATPNGLGTVAKSLGLPVIPPALVNENLNLRMRGFVEFGTARCVNGGAR